MASFGVRKIIVFVILNIRLIRAFKNAGLRTGSKDIPLSYPVVL